MYDQDYISLLEQTMIDYSKIALIFIRVVAFTAALIGFTGLVLIFILDTRGSIGTISFFIVDSLIVSVLLFLLSKSLARDTTKDL